MLNFLFPKKSISGIAGKNYHYQTKDYRILTDLVDYAHDVITNPVLN